MKKNLDLKQLEGRTFVIGREGHIYIDSRIASKHHAEIKIINGKILLRDLDSTNGTYLIKNRKLMIFERGEVGLDQRVSIGGHTNSILKLLSIANNFVSTDDSETQLDPEVLANFQQKTG